MKRPSILQWRSVHLLCSLLALLLFHPFVEALPQPWSGRLSSLLTTAVMLAAVWWTAQTRRHRVVAVALVSPAVLALWLRETLGPFAALAWIAFCLYVIGRLFATVLSRHTALVDRIFASLSVYLLIAMTFAYLHLLVYRLNPEAYHFPSPPVGEGVGDMLYFSLVTILTLGYGDIVPVNPFARMLTVTEAFIGAFFIAILVARLVSLGADGSGVEGPDTT
jgi:voltage-gated potassium channel Kch